MTAFVTYALRAEILMFVLIAIRCGCIQCTAVTRWRSGETILCLPSRESGRGEFGTTQSGAVETDSAGTGARRRVQGMLSLACFAKTITLGLILVRGTTGPYLAVSDVAFICTYGQLIFFLVQTQQTAIGVGYRSTRLQLVAAAVVAVLLLLSLIICAKQWMAHPNSHLSLRLCSILYYELGTTYLATCGAFAYNGLRVMCASRLHTAMFRRMLLLTIVCGLALLSKGLTFIIVAAGGWYNMMIPSVWDRHRFEAVVALEELLPSLVILILTERGKRGAFVSPAFVSPALSEASLLVRYGNVPSLRPGASVSPEPPPRNQYGYGAAVNQV